MIYLAVQPTTATKEHGLPRTMEALDHIGGQWMPMRPQGVEGPHRYPNAIISQEDIADFNRWVMDNGLRGSVPYMLDYEGPWLPAHRGIQWWWSQMTGQHTPATQHAGRSLISTYSATLYHCLRATPKGLPMLWGLPGGPMKHRPQDWWHRCIMGMLIAWPAWMPAYYRHDGDHTEQAPGWFRIHLDWVVSQSSGQTIIPCINLRPRPFNLKKWFDWGQIGQSIDTVSHPATTGVCLWVPSNGYDNLDEFDDMLADRLHGI